MRDYKIKTKILVPEFDSEQDIINISKENLVDENIISSGTIRDCFFENHEAKSIIFK